MMDINENALAAAANGLLLWTSVLWLAVMVIYLRSRIGNFMEFVRRALRMKEDGFQGGVLDVAVAMGTIALGLIVRTQTTWEFRVMANSDLRPEQMTLGSAIIAVGVLCLVRLLAPHNRYKCYFWTGLITAIMFAAGTYYVADMVWPEVD